MIEEVLLRTRNVSVGEFVIAKCLVQDVDEQRLFFELTPRCMCYIRLMYGLAEELLIYQH